MGQDGKSNQVTPGILATITLHLDSFGAVEQISFVKSIFNATKASVAAWAADRAGLIFLGDFRQ
jgi:hypothetical protein